MRLLPILLVSAFGLSACQSVSNRSEVNPAPNFSKLGLRKTGQVYTGKMSWYSVRTNRGTKTASGEKFTNSGNTAAHKTLPMGTMVEVTNLVNNRSAIVRINDRGPFKPGRIIDVSIGVAGKLDFVNSGVVPCRVEVLQPIGGANR